MPGILVVDDEPLIRALLEIALRAAGFQVWLAGDGDQAVDLYLTHGQAIDIVLLDMVMPRRNGLETLRLLRRINPDVLVCLMSGYLGDHSPGELFEQGVVRLFSKPFSIDVITGQLKQLLADSVVAGTSSGSVAKELTFAGGLAAEMSYSP